jgi:hypothetical protein
VSTELTGLRRPAPQGDSRLDLCDLYVFASPVDPGRTVLILTINPKGTPLHPDAVYRIAVDNDGDFRQDIAFNFVFSEPRSGSDGPHQSVDVFLALQSEARVDAAAGSRIFGDVDVSFDGHARLWRSGSFSFFAGLRSDTSFDDTNVVTVALELPTSYLGAEPDVRIWGKCSVLEDGGFVHVDRAGHPWVSGFFDDPDELARFRAADPNRHLQFWMGHLVTLLMENGGYTREEAVAAITTEGTLPDVLVYNPAKPSEYPNGRALTDNVADYRSRFLTNGQKTLPDMAPRDDLLPEFPYLGVPR